MIGWISLHRKIIDSPIYSDSQAVHLWLHCLLRANHKDTQFIKNGKLIGIKRGQFLTGRKALSAETGISESKIQRLLFTFEKLGMIEQQTTNKNRYISIINYDLYQDSEQQKNSRRTTDEQQVNTDNNVNNVNNENKHSTSSEPDDMFIKPDANALRPECESNANHKPRTKNQEPIKTYVNFDDFWTIYPKKQGKAEAQKKWKSLKINHKTFETIKQHLTIYEFTEKQFIPMGSTYLNQKRWLDEVDFIPYKKIIDEYNSVCTNLLPAHGCSEERKKIIDTFWNYNQNHQDFKFINAYFTFCNIDEFCRGNNEKNIKAGLNNILKPEFIERMSGKKG